MAPTIAAMPARTNTRRRIVFVTSVLLVIGGAIAAFLLTRQHPPAKQEVVTAPSNPIAKAPDPPAFAPKPRDLATLEQLAKESPTDSAIAGELARHLVSLANQHTSRKRYQEAESFALRAVEIASKLSAQSTQDGGNAALLVDAICENGDCRLERDPRMALQQYDRAVTIIEPISAAESTTAVSKDALRRALEQRAQAKLLLKKLSDAKVDWNRAILLEPENTRSTQLARWCMALAKSGYVTESLLAVEPLINGPQSNAGTLYNAARIYVQLSLTTNDNDTDFSTLALDLLQQAVTKGWNDVERLKSDEDLAPLRERTVYRQLILQLENKKAKGG